MHSASSPWQGSTNPLADAVALVQQLAHDLRQPLSGIEASAYYIDMVVSGARPDLIPHCRRLRRMVQQASWLLDDAALAVAFQPGPLRAFSLEQVCARVAERLFAEEEAVLDLHLSASVPAVLAPEALPRVFEHVVAFFRDAAGCPDPLHLRVGREGPMAEARWWSDACEDPEEAARLLTSSGVRSFLLRFAHAAGGSVTTEAGSARLAVTVRLPALGEQGE